jgi:hypothetical protein
LLRSIATSLLALATFAPAARASHPHESICLVNAPPDGATDSFVLQAHVGREYKQGPSKDTRDYKYQLRVCDDDNEPADDGSTQCTTYESAAVTHSPNAEVTLVGMVDKKKVFFRGIIDVESGKMTGKILPAQVDATKLVPFRAKLDCIQQTWIPLKPEAAKRE